MKTRNILFFVEFKRAFTSKEVEITEYATV